MQFPSNFRRLVEEVTVAAQAMKMHCRILLGEYEMGTEQGETSTIPTEGLTGPSNRPAALHFLAQGMHVHTAHDL